MPKIYDVGDGTKLSVFDPEKDTCPGLVSTSLVDPNGNLINTRMLNKKRGKEVIKETINNRIQKWQNKKKKNKRKKRR